MPSKSLHSPLSFLCPTRALLAVGTLTAWWGSAAFAAPAIIVRGEPGARPISLKASNAEVQTALLASQPTPGVAGTAVKVTLRAESTDLPAVAPGELMIQSQQSPALTAAMNGIVRQVSLRNRGWFAGKRIVFSIDDAAAQADYPSSTLAMAVAVDAMIAGWSPDPAFAAVGSLQADGQIAAVSQPIPRLLAAYRSGAQRIAVPDKMWSQVSDLLVAEGVASFSKAQMFTVGSLEELPPLAMDPPGREIESAIKRFREVQAAVRAPGVDADAELMRPDVKEALRDVLTIAPNHLTARLLLGRTTGQYKTLSLPGSLTAIEAIGMTLLKAARSNTPSEPSVLPAATARAEAERLKNAKAKLDPKSHGVINAIVAYAEAVDAYQEASAQADGNTRAKLQAIYVALRQIKDEYAKTATKP